MKSESDATDNTNIIWIFGDQHRAQALSCNQDPNVSTPNIDTLAAQGVHFDQAVATYPLCCPARGSLLTGRYPHHAVPGHEYPLSPEIPTVADAFNEAGYDTAYFGKWHVDGFHESEGRAAMHTVPRARRGRFKTWLGYENNNSQWDSYLHGHQGDEEVPHFRLPGYETDELTTRFVEYLASRAGKTEPFFAVLSVQPPHDPYVAPPNYMGRHRPADITLRDNVPPVESVREAARRELAGYYGMIENLDDAVERIRKVLDETDLVDSTRIVFFSDHGDMHGSHGQFRKMTAYEEAVRVPCIISGLGRYSAMRRTSRVPWLIGQPDLAPTTLGLCGIRPPESMEGFDYSPWVLQAEGGVHRADTALPGEPPAEALIQSVIPTGHGNSVDRPWRGVVTHDGWKLAVFEKTPWLMFNLTDDPMELVNLAHNPRYHHERRRLYQKLERLLEKVGDDFELGEF